MVHRRRIFFGKMVLSNAKRRLFLLRNPNTPGKFDPLANQNVPLNPENFEPPLFFRPEIANRPSLRGGGGLEAIRGGGGRSYEM